LYYSLVVQSYYNNKYNNNNNNILGHDLGQTCRAKHYNNILICNAEIVIHGVDSREIISCKSLRSYTIRQLIRRPAEHMDQPVHMITSPIISFIIIVVIIAVIKNVK